MSCSNWITNRQKREIAEGKYKCIYGILLTNFCYYGKKVSHMHLSQSCSILLLWLPLISVAHRNYIEYTNITSVRPKIKTCCIALCNRPKNLKIYGQHLNFYFIFIYFFNCFFRFFLLMNKNIKIYVFVCLNGI